MSFCLNLANVHRISILISILTVSCAHLTLFRTTLTRLTTILEKVLADALLFPHTLQLQCVEYALIIISALVILTQGRLEMRRPKLLAKRPKRPRL